MLHFGDIVRVSGCTVPPVDVVVGGSPCQDLSVAGARKGLLHVGIGSGETSRSGLLLEQIRIIKEIRAHDNGIGSFPLIWESICGRGTTLWAIEIDPTAVRICKEHLG